MGEGQGRLKQLPGAEAPKAQTAKPAEGASGVQPAGGGDKTEEDLFKGFNFGE